ncbi:MAG: UDP-N-acetylglucosamine--dolichyl-phosphate N-acetylglucosaminephosphotransferase [Pyrobaculum sp.]
MWLAVLATFVAGLAFGLWWIPFQKSRGITSRDIYKGVDGVPKAGGLVALVSATFGYALSSLYIEKAFLILLTALFIGVVGLVDDLRGLSEYLRVLAPLLAGFMLARSLGEITLTIPTVGLFYGATGWLAVLTIPVMTNAFNMLDPVNGFLPAANIAVALSLAVVAVLRGQVEALALLSIHAAASLALYFYNRYPAKSFNGNVGSYFLGGSLSTIAVAYDMASYLILAALPFVINGVLIIFSSGGIKGREKIQRPTYLKEGMVYQDCSSPIISLVRVTVAERPMSERQIFKALAIQVAISSSLTAAFAILLTYLKMPI